MTTHDELAAARKQMVDEQLAARGIRSRRVLDAMRHVPRERFVPPEMRDRAYADQALPISGGQTISQPYIVALMTEALELKGTERVLDVGTGSGYQTAVLAELAAEVVSIERHAELSIAAGRVLAELGYENIELHIGDGSLGWAPRAPYDGILVAAAAREAPPELLDQLAEGGSLVIPLGDAESQQLVRIRRRGSGIEQVTLAGCRFVPLVGRHEPMM